MSAILLANNCFSTLFLAFYAISAHFAIGGLFKIPDHFMPTEL